jgi:hypothetical protein
MAGILYANSLKIVTQAEENLKFIEKTELIVTIRSYFLAI